MCHDLLVIRMNLDATSNYCEVLNELRMMDVHKLHFLHHHGKVPDVHIQLHIQQYILLSQCVCQMEEQ